MFPKTMMSSPFFFPIYIILNQVGGEAEDQLLESRDKNQILPVANSTISTIPCPCKLKVTMAVNWFNENVKVTPSAGESTVTLSTQVRRLPEPAGPPAASAGMDATALDGRRVRAGRSEPPRHGAPGGASTPKGPDAARLPPSTSLALPSPRTWTDPHPHAHLKPPYFRSFWGREGPAHILKALAGTSAGRVTPS